MGRKIEGGHALGDFGVLGDVGSEWWETQDKSSRRAWSTGSKRKTERVQGRDQPGVKYEDGALPRSATTHP